jgi:hypothetical protein
MWQENDIYNRKKKKREYEIYNSSISFRVVDGCFVVSIVVCWILSKKEK